MGFGRLRDADVGTRRGVRRARSASGRRTPRASWRNLTERPIRKQAYPLAVARLPRLDADSVGGSCVSRDGGSVDEETEGRGSTSEIIPWDQLERTLREVPAVERVRVFGESTPSEIHVVASVARPAKDIARDVHALTSTTLKEEVDSRIVSVVQLGDEELSPHRRCARPILDSVVVGMKRDEGWVKLRLRCPDGTITEGNAPARATREGRAHAAVSASLQALKNVLADMDAHVEMENVILYPAGTDDLVLIHATFVERAQRRPVSGTAFIVDDTATAAARALLDALNRQLRFDRA